jgi:hypothetical protein
MDTWVRLSPRLFPQGLSTATRISGSVSGLLFSPLFFHWRRRREVSTRVPFLFPASSLVVHIEVKCQHLEKQSSHTLRLDTQLGSQEYVPVGEEEGGAEQGGKGGRLMTMMLDCSGGLGWSRQWILLEGDCSRGGGAVYVCLICSSQVPEAGVMMVGSRGWSRQWVLLGSDCSRVGGTESVWLAVSSILPQVSEAEAMMTGSRGYFGENITRRGCAIFLVVASFLGTRREGQVIAGSDSVVSSPQGAVPVFFVPNQCLLSREIDASRRWLRGLASCSPFLASKAVLFSLFLGIMMLPPFSSGNQVKGADFYIGRSGVLRLWRGGNFVCCLCCCRLGMVVMRVLAAGWSRFWSLAPTLGRGERIAVSNWVREW